MNLTSTDDACLTNTASAPPRLVGCFLATDTQGSPLQASGGRRQGSIAYTPFGHAAFPARLVTGFTGQPIEISDGHYLLGNGYRAYAPLLMRFTQTDDLSPFGAGGINAYAYCGAEPVNHFDPNGNVGFLVSLARGLVDEASGVLAKVAVQRPEQTLKHAKIIKKINIKQMNRVDRLQYPPKNRVKNLEFQEALNEPGFIELNNLDYTSINIWRQNQQPMGFFSSGRELNTIIEYPFLERFRRNSDAALRADFLRGDKLKAGAVRRKERRTKISR